MAEVTIHIDFGAQENEILHTISTFSPTITIKW